VSNLKEALEIDVNHVWRVEEHAKNDAAGMEILLAVQEKVEPS